MNRVKSTNLLREELVREVPYLRRFARSVVSDHAFADDLVQDTLVRAITRLDQYDQSRPMRPWLYRILHNLKVSRFRQDQARGVHVEFDTVREVNGNSNEGGDQGLMTRDISKALLQLPIAQREVLLLVSLEGMSYSDVCEVLDIPLGTVMSRLSRGRKMLRDLLDYEKPKTIRRAT